MARLDQLSELTPAGDTKVYGEAASGLTEGWIALADIGTIHPGPPSGDVYVNFSNTETDLSNISVPANQWEIGDVFEFHAFGWIKNTDSVDHTAVFNFRLGSTAWTRWPSSGQYTITHQSTVIDFDFFVHGQIITAGAVQGVHSLWLGQPASAEEIMDARSAKMMDSGTVSRTNMNAALSWRWTVTLDASLSGLAVDCMGGELRRIR